MYDRIFVFVLVLFGLIIFLILEVSLLAELSVDSIAKCLDLSISASSCQCRLRIAQSASRLIYRTTLRQNCEIVLAV
jgi:hypothetical protein